MTVLFKSVNDKTSKAVGNAAESKRDSHDPPPVRAARRGPAEQLRQRNGKLCRPPSVCKMMQVQKLEKGKQVEKDVLCPGES